MTETPSSQTRAESEAHERKHFTHPNDSPAFGQQRNRKSNEEEPIDEDEQDPPPPPLCACPASLGVIERRLPPSVDKNIPLSV